MSKLRYLFFLLIPIILCACGKDSVTQNTGGATLIQISAPKQLASHSSPSPYAPAVGTSFSHSLSKSPEAGTTETDESITILPPPEPLPTKAPQETYSSDELLSMSNKKQYWGYSSKNRDAFNRPSSVLSSQEQYGHLGAEFIKDNVPTIYLTFDEGYEYGCTGEILDVLKEKEVSAVFFVTMDYVKAEPELVRRMIDEGHVVGSHSVSHPSAGMPSLSIEKQTSEMKELHFYMQEHFDYNMYLFRYPAGIYSEQSLALMQTLGYRCIFWSFAYEDWYTTRQPNEAAALKKMTDQLHNGAIYLLHAVSVTNMHVLGDFIDQARQQGYEFSYYY